jgi:hypothetical protein
MAAPFAHWGGRQPFRLAVGTTLRVRACNGAEAACAVSSQDLILGLRLKVASRRSGPSHRRLWSLLMPPGGVATRECRALGSERQSTCQAQALEPK